MDLLFVLTMFEIFDISFIWKAETKERHTHGETNYTERLLPPPGSYVRWCVQLPVLGCAKARSLELRLLGMDLFIWDIAVTQGCTLAGLRFEHRHSNKACGLPKWWLYHCITSFLQVPLFEEINSWFVLINSREWPFVSAKSYSWQVKKMRTIFLEYFLWFHLWVVTVWHYFSISVYLVVDIKMGDGMMC